MKIGIEMPIEERYYDRLSSFDFEQKLGQETGRDFVLFKSCGIAFILIHGAPDGRVQFRGGLITTTALLKALIPAMQKAGLTEVKTLSCFGGAQPEAEIDGMKLSSFHTSHEEIQFAMLMDGVEFTFDFTEDEANAMDVPEGMSAYLLR